MDNLLTHFCFMEQEMALLGAAGVFRQQHLQGKMTAAGDLGDLVNLAGLPGSHEFEEAIIINLVIRNLDSSRLVLDLAFFAADPESLIAILDAQVKHGRQEAETQYSQHIDIPLRAGRSGSALSRFPFRGNFDGTCCSAAPVALRP